MLTVANLMMRSLFILLQYCLPKRLLTNLVSVLGDSEHPFIKGLFIRVFIRIFKVNMNEALFPRVEDYRCFNDFFTRALKPGARPLADSHQYILSPADGVISEIGQIDQGMALQAKGLTYQVSELLADSDLGRTFEKGSFATVYLSPKDYHRVHMPVSGKLSSTNYIPGTLFSVNETTTTMVERVLARNERMVNTFETPGGKVSIVLVGALIVAGIETVWGGGRSDALGVQSFGEDAPELPAGEELGRFFMGSTAVLLFPENSVEWLEGLEPGAPVQMGQAIGRKVRIE